MTVGGAKAAPLGKLPMVTDDAMLIEQDMLAQTTRPRVASPTVDAVAVTFADVRTSR